MTSRAGRPLPGCPARQATSTFGVLAADFILDVRDIPPPDGGGDGAITEVVGYFRPPGPAGTDAGKEPDLVAVAGLEAPAGSPVSQLAWQAFTSRAGPALIGQLLRTAILACPCTFPAAGCAALDECTLLRAIELAAGRPPGGLTHPGGRIPAREGHPGMPELPCSAASPPAISPLVTAGPHPRPLAGDCPVACLAGLLSPHALSPLLTASRDGQLSTVAGPAGLYRARTLGQVPGIGPGRTAEIEDLLLPDRLITSSECYLAAAASEQARQRRNWLAVTGGPVIGCLRQPDGFSQYLLARMSGLSVPAAARAETEPASWCRRRFPTTRRPRPVSSSAAWQPGSQGGGA